MPHLDDLPHLDPARLDLPTPDKLAPTGNLDHPPRILMLDRYSERSERTNRAIGRQIARL